MLDQSLACGLVARPHEIEQADELRRMTEGFVHGGKRRRRKNAVSTIILPCPPRSRNSGAVGIVPAIFALLVLPVAGVCLGNGLGMRLGMGWM